MSKRPRNRKPDSHQENELEQFEAYGSYSYEYMPQDEAAEDHYDDSGDEPYARQPAYAQRIPLEKEPRRKRKYAFWVRVLIFVIAAAVGLVILQESSFRLRTVYVVGNKMSTKEHVVASAGLAKGQNLLNISEDEIRRNLSRDHTLELVSIQKSLPGTLYLYVSERTPVASMQCRGFLYTLDPEGMVMDESSTLMLPEGIPVITGFTVESIAVGQILKVKEARQIQAYKAIIEELYLQLYADQISELNLGDVDNLFLVTVDGITVRLGSSQHARAKVGALRTDMIPLRQLGKTSGTLDVSIPEDAKYLPED